MKHPNINQETCIGCGTCPALCGSTFGMDMTTGKAIVTNPTGNTEPEIDTAIASCPTQSITWTED